MRSRLGTGTLLLLSERRAKRPVVTKAESRGTGCAISLYVLATCFRAGP